MCLWWMAESSPTPFSPRQELGQRPPPTLLRRAVPAVSASPKLNE